MQPTLSLELAQSPTGFETINATLRLMEFGPKGGGEISSDIELTIASPSARRNRGLGTAPSSNSERFMLKVLV